MKFKATSLKQTFLVLKTVFSVLFIILALVYFYFLWSIITTYLKNPDNFTYILTLNTVALCIFAIVESIFIILIKTLSKSCKEAEMYMLSIENNNVYILCNGVETIVNADDIESFDILPRGSEKNSFKTKWTETAIIKLCTGEEYRLYYLKNVRQIKILYKTSNKSV